MMMKKGPVEDGRVYLSFDDGPDPDYTPRILKLLDFFQVPATFFLLGRCVHRYPGLVREVCERGHALGNHTHSHRHPWLLSEAEARAELHRAQREIQAACGRRPRLFRPPHGRLRPAMLEEAWNLNMAVVLWSRSAIDWGETTSTRAIDRRLSRVAAGDILLCHDGRLQKNHPEMTLEVLPGFIELCQSRGLDFGTLDGLLPSRRALSQ